MGVGCIPILFPAGYLFTINLVVSWNRGTPKSSSYRWVFPYKPTILDTPIYGNPHLDRFSVCWLTWTQLVDCCLKSQTFNNIIPKLDGLIPELFMVKFPYVSWLIWFCHWNHHFFHTSSLTSVGESSWYSYFLVISIQFEHLNPMLLVGGLEHEFYFPIYWE